MAGWGGSADAIGVRNLRNGLIRLRKELQLPATLKEAGVAPQKLWHHSKQIVESTLKDPCMKTNPVRVEAFQIRRILEAVTGRV
jgi:alcohol dehydrogenase class IV